MLADICISQLMNEISYSSITDQSTDLLGLRCATEELMMMNCIQFKSQK